MSRVASVVFLSILLAISCAAQTQTGTSSQPTVWATKPAAFEKMVNERLATGQSSIDKIVAVKGARTIENTLVPYDEALRPT
jgi:thimet oligopeptidase